MRYDDIYVNIQSKYTALIYMCGNRAVKSKLLHRLDNNRYSITVNKVCNIIHELPLPRIYK